MQSRVYFYSPFSRETASDPKNRFLVFSFLLSDLFLLFTLPQKQSILPRFKEHSALLLFAFPEKREHLYAFHEALLFDSPEKELFSLLDPLLQISRDEKHFLFFLLKHQKEISLLTHSTYLYTLLHKLYPEGLSFLQDLLCDFFHKKGFYSLIPEVKQWMSLLNTPKALS
ncbi:MAG: hypothetical protein FJZ58_07970 [Chlamydiae bacterium]|nr:hypothetical protein [Chlamydiota bacterium]